MRTGSGVREHALLGDVAEPAGERGERLAVGLGPAGDRARAAEADHRGRDLVGRRLRELRIELDERGVRHRAGLEQLGQALHRADRCEHRLCGLVRLHVGDRAGEILLADARAEELRVDLGLEHRVVDEAGVVATGRDERELLAAQRLHRVAGRSRTAPTCAWCRRRCSRSRAACQLRFIA